MVDPTPVEEANDLHLATVNVGLTIPQYVAEVKRAFARMGPAQCHVQSEVIALFNFEVYFDVRSRYILFD